MCRSSAGASTSQASCRQASKICAPRCRLRPVPPRHALCVPVTSQAASSPAAASASTLRDASAAAQLLRASLVHAQMKAAAGLLAGLHTPCTRMPNPRLVRADVATCFQVQAQVQALCCTSPDAQPYTQNTAAGRVRFLPMSEAKGGCITMPVFMETPHAFLHDVVYCREG